MQWFIKRNIFSYISMSVLLYDLDFLSSEKEIHFIETEYGKIIPKRLESIDSDNALHLKNAISRMDCKPMFDLPEARERLNKNDYFTVASKENGEIVGWTWGAVRRIFFRDFNCHLIIRNNDVFSYNMYVEKKYRGKRINNLMQYQQFFHLKNKGFRRTWALVHKWNQASVNSLKKMGWKVVGEYNFIKFFYMNIKFPPKGI